MRLAIPSLFALAILLSAADQKGKPKPPDIELLEARCQRSESRVLVDGLIRNTSGKPLQKVLLTFRFIAPGRNVVATKNAPIEEEFLEPGAEAEFHMQAPDPGRAVEFDVGATDGGNRDLRLSRTGPFRIE